MKALTDKIIDELLKFQKESASVEECSGTIDSVIEIIRDTEKNADFEEVARVMMKHLANPEKYHPHYRVFMDSASAELLEGQKCTGQVMDYIPD